jgi:hypothetical protein
MPQASLKRLRYPRILSRDSFAGGATTRLAKSGGLIKIWPPDRTRLAVHLMPAMLLMRHNLALHVNHGVIMR